MRIICCQCGKHYEPEFLTTSDSIVIVCPHCQFSHAVDFIPLLQTPKDSKPLKEVNLKDYYASYTSFWYRAADRSQISGVTEDGNVSSFPVNYQMVVCVMIANDTGKSVTNESINLRFRDDTDDPGGSYIGVASVTEVSFGDSTVLSHGSYVTSSESRCTNVGTYDDAVGLEFVTSNGGAVAISNLADGECAECQWAIAFDLADIGHTYSLLVNSTTQVADVITLGTIVTASPAAYPVAPNDLTHATTVGTAGVDITTYPIAPNGLTHGTSVGEATAKRIINISPDDLTHGTSIALTDNLLVWNPVDVVNSYDSGGAGSLPGGGDPDYSSVSVWEDATDIFLQRRYILDCYDSQTHSEGLYISGATGIRSVILKGPHRTIRSSANCRTPFNGRQGTGATFETLGSNKIFNWSSENGLTHDLNLIVTMTTSGIGLAIASGIAANINLTGSGSLGAGGLRGYFSITDGLFYNCVAHDIANTGNGYVYSFHTSDGRMINCAAVNNTSTGGTAYGFRYNSGTPTYWNCYAADNTSSDYYGSTDPSSDFYPSKDTSGSTQITYEYDSNGLINSEQTAGQNPYNDLIGILLDQGFIFDGTSGHPLFYKDITGKNRTTPEVADTAWPVGANIPARYLALNDTTHATSIGEASASISTGVRIHPDSLTHGTSVDTVTLTLTHQVAPNDTTHATHVDEANITMGAYQVAPNSVTHGTSIDQVNVTLKYAVAPDSVTHATHIDEVNLTTEYNIQPDGLTHATSAGEASLTLIRTIAPDDVTHGTSIDQINVTLIYSISVDSLTHATHIDEAGINTAFNIQPDDMTHATSLGTVSLVTIRSVAPSDMTHATAVDQVNITLEYNISVNSVNHATHIDEAGINTAYNIAPDDMAHATGVDPVTLTLEYNIAPDIVTHGTTVGEASLTVIRTVSPDQMTHATHVDAVNVTGENVYNIHPLDVTHATQVGTASVTLEFNINPDNVIHATHVDAVNVAATPEFNIAPDDVNHATSLGEVALTLIHNISLSDLTHATSVNEVNVSSGIVIYPSDVTHGTSVDSVSLNNVTRTINPDDLTHQTFVGQASLAPIRTITPDDVTHATSSDETGVVLERSVIPDRMTHGTSIDQVSVEYIRNIHPEDLTHQTHSDEAGIDITKYIISPDDVTHQTYVDEVHNYWLGIYNIHPDDMTHRTRVTLPFTFLDSERMGDIAEVQITGLAPSVSITAMAPEVKIK